MSINEILAGITIFTLIGVMIMGGIYMIKDIRHGN